MDEKTLDLYNEKFRKVQTLEMTLEEFAALKKAKKIHLSIQADDRTLYLLPPCYESELVLLLKGKKESLLREYKAAQEEFAKL